MYLMRKGETDFCKLGGTFVLTLLFILNFFDVSDAVTANCTVGVLNTAKSRCYTLERMPMTWAEGRSRCQTLGGDLAVLNTTSEVSFINTEFGTAYYWVGLTDSVTEGTWVWVDGSTTIALTWASGHPSLDTSKNCGLRFSDATLQQLSCTLTKYALCQLPPVLIPDPPALGNRYRREEDNVLENQTMISFFHAKTRVHCATSCSRDATCLGFVYAMTQNTQNCELTKEQTGSSVTVDGTASKAYRRY